MASPATKLDIDVNYTGSAAEDVAAFISFMKLEARRDEAKTRLLENAVFLLSCLMMASIVPLTVIMIVVARVIWNWQP